MFVDPNGVPCPWLLAYGANMASCRELLGLMIGSCFEFAGLLSVVSCRECAGLRVGTIGGGRSWLNVWEVGGLPRELWVPRVRGTPAVDTAAADEACFKLGALKEMLRDTLGMYGREGRGEA